MKILMYIALFWVAVFLFLPQTSTDGIRNLPILLLILSVILIYILVRIFKHVSIMVKTVRLLKSKGLKPIKIRCNPFASRLHGHYSVTFLHESQTVELVLMAKKRKYQRYHFESANRLEFYRANRVVFQSIKTRGATVSNLVEVNRVGKRKIKWDHNATVRAILFDKMPEQITDSFKKENIDAGEQICKSDAFVLDWQFFCKHFE